MSKVHFMLYMLVAFVAGGGLGFGFYAWLHAKELEAVQLIRSEFFTIVGKIRDSLLKGEANLRTDVKDVLARIEKFL